MSIVKPQKYVNEGKPVNVLDDQEQFCISLMGVPAVKQRIRALGLKFTAAEKAAEAAAIFKVSGSSGMNRSSVTVCGGGVGAGGVTGVKQCIKALGLKFIAAEKAAEAAAISKVCACWLGTRRGAVSYMCVCVCGAGAQLCGASRPWG
jgi:hypothetical protein